MTYQLGHRVAKGPQDADPLGTRHPRIDEPPAQTKLIKIDESFQQPAHWNSKLPKWVDETCGDENNSYSITQLHINRN